jgi:retrograde regulation protein 2
LPTIFEDRAAISLYDAQYDLESDTKKPVPKEIIDSLVACLLRFKTICFDFGVSEEHIRVLATEAMREAKNGSEIIAEILKRTGWQVKLLQKEEEGRIGALGVASSFASVQGLVMDLGGGSTQITWMISKDGEVETAKQAVSLPYGAAALIKKIQVAETTDDGLENLRAEIVKNFEDAIKTINIPKELKDDADAEGGFVLYLSGGGFRGWGYLLLSEHSIRPYPIPIINGFGANNCDFNNVRYVTDIARGDVFRVSDRRVTQVPAVALLVQCLERALPDIKLVRFCQGMFFSIIVSLEY